MPDRIPWTERTFDFDFPVDRHPELLERLRATPDRADAIVRGVPDEVLRRRDGATWSIQENAGHLADLEALFTGRLDDIESGAAELRPADMTNRATNEADHNARPTAAVLDDLRTRRAALVARLDAYTTDDLARAGRHPRLGTPMRVVDMMLFHAEHDDHHIARMEALRRLWL